VFGKKQKNKAKNFLLQRLNFLLAKNGNFQGDTRSPGIKMAVRGAYARLKAVYFYCKRCFFLRRNMLHLFVNALAGAIVGSHAVFIPRSFYKVKTSVQLGNSGIVAA